MFKAELSCFRTCCADTQSLTSFSVLGLLAFGLYSLSSAIGVGSQRSSLNTSSFALDWKLCVSVVRSLLHRAIENFRGWTLHLLAIVG